MRKRNKKIIVGIFILVIAVIFAQYKMKRPNPDGEITQEIKPFKGSIQNIISTTGTVLPKNRLEIKPPVNGRVDMILVQEGDNVKTGQMLAWMSSTERAALIDAARGQGEDTLKYWQEVYKAIPLISPIDAEVIVATTQPGQTITTSDAVIVLSDHLIVRAQVDETDIGKIKLNQDAIITLDAYPGTNISAKVEHMYYESKTVNNVTMYEVDLLPESTPSMLRSGMNTTINFIENSKGNALLIPLDAVVKDNDRSYVLIKQADNGEPIRQAVTLGISDDKNTEVLSGVSENDTILLKTKKYTLPQANVGKNPFMPAHPQERRQNQQTK